MVTVRDVALRAGVAIATVSRVVNYHPHVRPEVRERVLRAIRELDYVPNRAARDLRTGTARVLGFVMSDIRNPFYAEISRGIEDLAYSRGYAVLVANSDFNPNKERMYLNTLRAENAAGVIISPDRRSGVAYSSLLESGVPIVTIDRPLRSPRTDTVYLDNRMAMRMAVHHLIEFGHKRIALFGTQPQWFSTTERVAGFRKALNDHGLDSPDEFIRIAPRDNLATAAIDLLTKAPTAIVATSNPASRAMLKAISDRGVTMPRDISLIGIDDAEWAELVSVPLTVVAQPTRDIGKTAAELLFERIAQSAPPQVREVKMPPELRVRDSTGPPRRSTAL